MKIQHSILAGLFVFSGALALAEDKPAAKIDETNPVAVAKAFLVCIEKTDVPGAKALLSEKLKKKFATDEELGKFLKMWLTEGKITEISDPAEPAALKKETKTSLQIKYEKNGQVKESHIRMAKEGDAWKWDEN